jgi:hypothetical protein
MAIGDRDRAKQSALAAYKWAWADGGPFVYRYELNKARALLEEVGAEIPNLSPYDPAKAQKLPFEDEVAARHRETPRRKGSRQGKRGLTRIRSQKESHGPTVNC